MTTPHRVALCALVRTFSDPPEEAAFQLPQEARLALGVFLVNEIKARVRLHVSPRARALVCAACPGCAVRWRVSARQRCSALRVGAYAAR
jgi:hypothetical protein